MGISQSTSTRFIDDDEEEEEEGSPAYQNMQNHRKSSEDSALLKMLLSCSLIYKATKGLLQKVCSILFNCSRPRKTADPLLPIRNPPSTTVTPLLCSSSHSHSILENTFESVTIINEEEEEIYSYSSERNELDGELLVSGTEISEEIAEVIEEEEYKEEEDGKVEVKNIVMVNEKERKIKHYRSSHKILLVGEGDFSFSACLALAFGSATNIVATSLNSLAFLKKNYGNAESNILEIRSRGGRVMHGIDATQIANHQLLPQTKYDRIVFNFPFAGFFRKLPAECQLRRHRRLVSLFLKNAKEMISENGEIHISHKTNGIHAEFKLESIASSHGLRLIQAVKFKCHDYPGYNTKFGFGGDGNFNCYPSKTFKFGLKTAPLL